MLTSTLDARRLFIDSDSANSEVGVRFRKSRPGPEFNLVESFLRAKLFYIPVGCRATIFREPRLESGFPDLVIVIWRERITRDWRYEREYLEPHDLRLMHFLYRARRAYQNELIERFGKRTISSIDRLHEAGMIRPIGSAWAPRALRKSFAASKIIAIEAKIGKWTEALNQALLNTWFASMSYVLIPDPPNRTQVKEAQRLGIGICSLDNQEVKEVASKTTRLPRSYASWMLNDWAWKSAQDLGDAME